mmetsp:Transcript_29626/g.42308  ORF Transcript_29626/g.42308 Transcript_29626/m.42308 type:complete len:293 (+) Transcript_29626:1399-2277(+)
MSEFQSNSRRYRYAVAHEEMNSRRRNTMEDCHRIIPVMDETHSILQNYSYFGIYDGHGGRQIVDFLEKALEQSIANELTLPDSANIPERLTRAFLITDMNSRKLDITTSGATAVSVLLSDSKFDSNESRKLYVANVGDSRAVLVSSKRVIRNQMDIPIDSPSGYVATRLTYDHRAEDADEQQRIKDAGGFITRNRVLGILAVSRSFGDHGMKDFVTACPYVSETNLSDAGDCPMLILACDGVWDTLSDQDAADLLMERYLTEGIFTDAAECLVHAAIERGSADNVTAIVVFL